MLVYERLSAGSDALRKSMLPKDGKVTVPVPAPILKVCRRRNLRQTRRDFVSAGGGPIGRADCRANVKRACTFVVQLCIHWVTRGV